MKKLLFCVLALIVLAGTLFAPSTAWSQSDCLYNEVCFLSNYSGTVGVPTIFTSPGALNQEKTILQNQDNTKLFEINGYSPVVFTIEELGVSSWPSISCLSCDTIGNPLNVITDNGLGQKRVAHYLC